MSDLETVACKLYVIIDEIGWTSQQDTVEVLVDTR